jgi:hypothetical protein
MRHAGRRQVSSVGLGAAVTPVHVLARTTGAHGPPMSSNTEPPAMTERPMILRAIRRRAITRSPHPHLIPTSQQSPAGTTADPKPQLRNWIGNPHPQQERTAEHRCTASRGVGWRRALADGGGEWRRALPPSPACARLCETVTCVLPVPARPFGPRRAGTVALGPRGVS